MRVWSFALCFLALSASAATARDCYAPTPAEMARYQTITGQLAASGARPPASAASDSRVDLDWALALEARVKAGEQPSAADTARYEDIAKRLAARRPSEAPTPPPSAPVSDEDFRWALALEARVKAGEQPSAADAARYENIARRLAASQSTGQSPAPVSEDDMAWAVALQAAVQDGARASEAELARYDDIYRRSPPPPFVAPEANGPAPSGAPVSAEDLAWAQSLQTRAQAGEPPSDADMARYRDIFERYQTAATATASRDALPVSEADITWALALERRVHEACSVP